MADSTLSVISDENYTLLLPASKVCNFSSIKSVGDVYDLVLNPNCYRHSIPFSLFLTLAYLCILGFGLVGNSLVIYVVGWKIKTRSASSIFILNLAFADILVILCCIPATLAANLFIRKSYFQKSIIMEIIWELEIFETIKNARVFKFSLDIWQQHVQDGGI